LLLSLAARYLSRSCVSAIVVRANYFDFHCGST
jgi:hypothetical protein